MIFTKIYNGEKILKLNLLWKKINRFLTTKFKVIVMLNLQKPWNSEFFAKIVYHMSLIPHSQYFLF